MLWSLEKFAILHAEPLKHLDNVSPSSYLHCLDIVYPKAPRQLTKVRNFVIFFESSFAFGKKI
jgi:hypothetical protein